MSGQSFASIPAFAPPATRETSAALRIMLRVAADQFASRQDHSPRQVEQFEQRIAQLIGKADAPARLELARRIARHPQTPTWMLAALDDMGGEASLYLLRFAPLPRERLAPAVFGHEDRACALASREGLDPELAAALAMRPEPAIVLALTRNIDAPLDARTLANLARRAERDAPLAAALQERAGSTDPM